MVNSPITSVGTAACASALVNSGACVVTVTGTVRAAPVATAAVFTEGNDDGWSDVIALGNLPVFIE